MTVTMHHDRQFSTQEKDGAIRITIPISIKRKGGKKYVLAPTGEISPFVPAKVDETIVRALVKSFKWREQFESGEAASVRHIARKEGLPPSYISKLMPLSLLAPDIIEAILIGRQPKLLQLEDMVYDLPVYWPEQRRKLGFAAARK